MTSKRKNVFPSVLKESCCEKCHSAQLLQKCYLYLCGAQEDFQSQRRRRKASHITKIFYQQSSQTEGYLTKEIYVILTQWIVTQESNCDIQQVPSPLWAISTFLSFKMELKVIFFGSSYILFL